MHSPMPLHQLSPLHEHTQLLPFQTWHAAQLQLGGGGGGGPADGWGHCDGLYVRPLGSAPAVPAGSCVASYSKMRVPSYGPPPLAHDAHSPGFEIQPYCHAICASQPIVHVLVPQLQPAF